MATFTGRRHIAARLEALAETRWDLHLRHGARPYSQTSSLTPSRNMGEQSVKNIARPVRVYAMGPAIVASVPGVVGTTGRR